MKPSADLVLQLLRDHPEGLTQMDVLRLGGGDSLAQRVHELIAEGHRIEGEYEQTPNGQRVKRYRIREALYGWGVPFASPRRCPSCRLSHSPGTTCAPVALRT